MKLFNIKRLYAVPPHCNAAILVSLISFLLFYFFTLNSMLMPHAQNLYFARALGVALFISIISTFVYFGFIYKWRSGGKTSWEMLSIELKSKTKRVKMLVFFSLAVPLFSAGLTFFMVCWVAYPTYIFAHDPFERILHCEKKEPWGKPSRNRNLISAFDESSGEAFIFPWVANDTFICPGRINVAGRAWFFGYYVESIKQ